MKAKNCKSEPDSPEFKTPTRDKALLNATLVKKLHVFDEHRYNLNKVCTKVRKIMQRLDEQTCLKENLRVFMNDLQELTEPKRTTKFFNLFSTLHNAVKNTH